MRCGCRRVIDCGNGCPFLVPQFVNTLKHSKLRLGQINMCGQVVLFSNEKQRMNFIFRNFILWLNFKVLFVLKKE